MNQIQLKLATKTWFETLRDRLCSLFETLENAAPQGLYEGEAGSFVFTPWTRNASDSGNKGGGVAGLLRGRLFEKAGIHVSTVYGQLDPEFARHVKGADRDPGFWASGLSLIAHPFSPRIPAVHMNTRLIVW